MLVFLLRLILLLLASSFVLMVSLVLILLPLSRVHADFLVTLRSSELKKLIIQHNTDFIWLVFVESSQERK